MSISLENHPLGKTAQFVAACRAIETNKPSGSRGFNDPWATDFAGMCGVEMLETIRKFSAATAAGLEGYIIERTIFLDEVLREALAKPDIRQVVIAAVGGDGRPYRIDFPKGTVLYQMDFPQVMQYRSHVFEKADAKPRCDLRSVGVDLSKDGWHDALLAAGFDKSKPSVWIVEGLLMYLTMEECEGFISKIASLCQAGSAVCGDIFTKEITKSEKLDDLYKWWHDTGAPKPQFYIEEPEIWFSKFGFDAQTQQCKDLGDEFGFDEKKLNGGYSIEKEESVEETTPHALYFKALKKGA